MLVAGTLVAHPCSERGAVSRDMVLRDARMPVLSDELGQRGEHGIPIGLVGCSPARAEQRGKLRCPLIIK